MLGHLLLLSSLRLRSLSWFLLEPGPWPPLSSCKSPLPSSRVTSAASLSKLCALAPGISPEAYRSTTLSLSLLAGGSSGSTGLCFLCHITLWLEPFNLTTRSTGISEHNLKHTGLNLDRTEARNRDEHRVSHFTCSSLLEILKTCNNTVRVQAQIWSSLSAGQLSAHNWVLPWASWLKFVATTFLQVSLWKDASACWQGNSCLVFSYRVPLSSCFSCGGLPSTLDGIWHFMFFLWLQPLCQVFFFEIFSCGWWHEGIIALSVFLLHEGICHFMFFMWLLPLCQGLFDQFFMWLVTWKTSLPCFSLEGIWHFMFLMWLQPLEKGVLPQFPCGCWHERHHCPVFIFRASGISCSSCGCCWAGAKRHWV